MFLNSKKNKLLEESNKRLQSVIHKEINFQSGQDSYVHLLDQVNAVIDQLSLLLNDKAELEAEVATLKSQLSQSHREMNDIEQRFNLMCEATADGLWDLTFIPGRDFDEDYPFWWSQAFRHMLGYENERDFPNIARSWSDRLHPDDKAGTFAAFGAHLDDRSGNTGYDIEYRLKLKNGQYRWFRARGATLRDSKGNPHFELLVPSLIYTSKRRDRLN